VIVVVLVAANSPKVTVDFVFEDYEVPLAVVIKGTGLIGLVAGWLLGRYGVLSWLLTRYRSRGGCETCSLPHDGRCDVHVPPVTARRRSLLDQRPSSLLVLLSRPSRPVRRAQRSTLRHSQVKARSGLLASAAHRWVSYEREKESQCCALPHRSFRDSPHRGDRTGRSSDLAAWELSTSS